MTTTVSNTEAPRSAATATAVFTDRKGVAIAPSGLTAATMAKRGFTGKVGQVLVVPGSTTKLYVGLGDGSAVTADQLRTAAAALARAAWNESALTIDILGALPKFDKTAGAQAITEGVLGATYQYGGKPQNNKCALQDVTVGPVGSRLVKEGVRRGTVVGEAMLLTRELVNLPPADLTPVAFADRALLLGQEKGFSVEVWDENRCREERLGGLLGVAQGGLEPPRLVRFEWNPPGASKRGKAVPPLLAVVGKGITFDSGGLSLKPSNGMMTMKCDMAGAAATLSLFTTLAEIQPACRVIGYACLSENLPGERATKPGDVHTARNGKTFEILNTDAEGRLVLADGLSLAVEEKPDAIVDLATLTGAIIVALGNDVGGVFSNHDGFAQQVLAASKVAGEPMWQLPMWNNYRKQLDSDVADMKNIGTAGQAGSIMAALFLQEFVGTTPWVHLDIAGTAWTDSGNELGPRGGTGAAVRTLVALVERFSRP
jgi:leucyl aminopeptidase